jgi:DNA alkylation damage repair protein AlkB
MDSDTPAYVPRLRGGGQIGLRMLCLGRHWNPQTYRYEDVRSDFDGRPAPHLPDELRAIAEAAASAAGMALVPDVCIINYYGRDGRLGLHQDKAESPASLAAGLPVVSVSIGDTACFLFGGKQRTDSTERVWLTSGDAFVFGGAARLRFHGISHITPSTAPLELGLDGRFNLTFRRC